VLYYTSHGYNLGTLNAKRHTDETYPRENGKSVSIVMAMDSSLRRNDDISIFYLNTYIT